MKGIPYVPRVRVMPGRVLNVGSAWFGIESILYSLLDEFRVGRNLAVELGVEYGYSTAALANYFGRVIGVDTFLGLDHDRDPHFCDKVRLDLFDYPNVSLFQMDWKEFAAEDQSQIDLIHVDMDHNYEQTFEAGEWAVQHAPIVIFHDTVSWPEGVGRACEDLADKYGLCYYNYAPDNGLGILSQRTKK